MTDVATGGPLGNASGKGSEVEATLQHLDTTSLGSTAAESLDLEVIQERVTAIHEMILFVRVALKNEGSEVNNQNVISNAVILLKDGGISDITEDEVQAIYNQIQNQEYRISYIEDGINATLEDIIPDVALDSILHDVVRNLEKVGFNTTEVEV